MASTETTHVYAAKFTGADQVIQGLTGINRASADAATTAVSSSARAAASTRDWSGRLDDLSGKFKSVSRDIDVVGGDVARMATAAIDDLLGVGAAITTGGPLAAIALLGTAVAGVSKIIQENHEIETKLNLASISAYNRRAEEFEKSVKRMKDANASISHAHYEDLVLRVEVAKKAMDGLAAGTDAYRAAAKRWSDLDNERIAVRDALVQKDKDGAEALRKLKEATDEATAADNRRKKAQEALRDLSLGYQAEFNRRREAAQKEKEDTEALIFRLGEQAEAADEAGEVEVERAAREARSNLVIEKAEDKANEARARAKEAIDKKTEAHEKEAAALRQKAEAEERAMKVAMAAQVVNQAYAFGMFYVGESIGFATRHLQKFSDLNRDNYKTMLEISANTVAAIVAETQAFLFNLGLRSAEKSVFEQAEALKEMALGAGSAAAGDYAGAAMHAVSALLHNEASKGYAVIGGGAVGLSLGIGATRGEGGLFAANPNSDRSEGGGAGVSAGEVRGSQRSERGSGKTVVQIFYGPGSVNTADEQKTANVVVRALKRGRKDGFLN